MLALRTYPYNLIQKSILYDYNQGQIYGFLERCVGTVDLLSRASGAQLPKSYKVVYFVKQRNAT